MPEPFTMAMLAALLAKAGTAVSSALGPAAATAGTNAAMTAAPSVFAPGLASAVGGGANLGLDVGVGALASEAGVAGMGLSESLAPMLKGATGALRFASKIIPNKQAKTMLNLMSMGTGAGENVGDPKALLKSMSGPMEDIGKSVTEESESKKKRLSELIPPTSTAPRPAPTTIPTPSSRSPGIPLPRTSLLNPDERLRSVRGF